MKKVLISCKKLVEYSTTVELTDLQFTRLKELEGIGIEEKRDPELFEVINDNLGYMEENGSGNELIDITIEDDDVWDDYLP
jgi:hypothetical protein